VLPQMVSKQLYSDNNDAFWPLLSTEVGSVVNIINYLEFCKELSPSWVQFSYNSVSTVRSV